MTESTPVGTSSDEPAGEDLKRLAEMHGVSTEYWDYHGNRAAPTRATLVAVLAALGVAAATDAQIKDSLADAELAPWRRILPPTVVRRQGWAAPVAVHVPDGAAVKARVELESGGSVELEQAEDWERPREVDGVLTGRASFRIPGDLPLGWHTLVAEIDAAPPPPPRPRWR